jgi:16S rRNA (adenine(1408)-N(1))-methyltransferase
LPCVLARRSPDRLFIGLDANVAALREVSGRAFRSGPANVLYARAAVEDLPRQLFGVADQVTVVLPWGSLLAAVAGPDEVLLRGIRRLCRDDARLAIVLALDPDRDRAEWIRLGLPRLDAAHLNGPLAAAYAEAGFVLKSVRPLGAPELAAWPSTWARKLAHGRPRSCFRVEATAR